MSNMQFANNAATTLASGITNSATSLTVASGAGALFPALSGSQYFYCTLENSAGTVREIVKVTARSTDTFTITRAQDGTTGQAFSTGDKVELRLVRANLTDFPLLDEANTFTQAQTFSSGASDSYGTLRSVPVNSQTTGYTLTAADCGRVVSITTGGVTAPASVLSAGNAVTIYNNSGSSQTITQGSGLTLQWAGQSSSTTGNRTLGLYGICTILFISSTSAVITGAGLT